MSAENQSQNQSRRSFLALIPLGVFTTMLTSIGVAAFRFLRPRISTGGGEWSYIASVAELTGSTPIPKTIVTERVDGWSLTTEEHHVFVLPASNNQVLSAICPHEGCEVFWERDTNRFSCPCHESYFAADGSRLTGPARRGLDPLPSRVLDGKLQAQHQTFENNSVERVTRT